jgi:Helicase HerA, central domain
MKGDENMRKNIERPYLRIAAVQIDYQPLSYLSSGGSPLSEPIISDPISGGNNHCLNEIKNQRNLKDTCDLLAKNAELKYLKTYADKIKDILGYCYANGVDLLVFPEYSIPVQIIEQLKDFSPPDDSSAMTIVAGIGHLGKKDITNLKNIGVSTNNISVANNAAIIMSPDGDFLVSKKKAAHGENIEGGTGPNNHELKFGKNTFKLSISICLDYLTEITSIREEQPDIAIVSALSKNTIEFTGQTPRDFLTIFSNHSLYGGTCILSPAVTGEIFVAKNRNGTEPLNRSLEAIVILDWDWKNRKLGYPSPLNGVAHPIFAVSQIIYSGKDEKISRGIHDVNLLMKEDNDNLDRDNISVKSSNLLELIESQNDNNEIIRRSFEKISDLVDNIKPDRLRSLTRHCILREDALTINEWRYQQLNEIITKFRKIRTHDIDDDNNLTEPLKAYIEKARNISGFVRSKLQSSRHKGTRKTSSGKEIQSILVARLGSYTTPSALKSLSKQLTMLKTLALSKDPNIILCYRFRTEKDSLGFMRACFDIICTTHSRDEDEVEELREGLGQLIHVTFTGAYSIGYSFDDAVYEELFEKIQNLSDYTVEIETKPNEHNQLSSNPPDWGMINDLLRSLREPVLIELQCSKSLLNTQVKTSLVSEENREKVNSSKAAKSILNQILIDESNNETNNIKNLQLRIFIGSSKEIPHAVLNMIGVELSGGNEFNIITSYIEQPRQSILKSPGEILKFFHPPIGHTYATSGSKKDNLNRATNETHFPIDGVTLGKANIRTVRSDEEIDVNISPEDRLKHTYIIGRTGSGKTNLLKSMASQDVQVPGRGVTIIDPHGDLVDYVLRTIPKSRASEVTLIDLSRQDVVPVLNPLDLDVNDLIVRDRTIQELIILLKSRIYHEYTGPVFEEIVRAVFETMLDPGYPVPASFTEIPSFLMDKDLQKKITNFLVDQSLVQRWKFEPNLARSNDHGDKLHWVTSKFNDIARDSTLKCVFGGAKSTVDIDKIVNSGGILLVKISESVIGKSSADFIGSLILLKLRMAIIRRRQNLRTQNSSQQPYHFVYVDEFQNFVNAEFDVIVAEARKFNVGFTLAHQNLEQLRGFDRNTGMKDNQLINSIIGNVGNLVIFSHGIYDAEIFSKQLGISSEDLMRIGKYEAIAKILIDNDSTTPFTLKPNLAPDVENPLRVNQIEASMRTSGVWQDREKLLVEINRRIKDLKDIIIQKEKELEEESKKQHEEHLKKARSASHQYVAELERTIVQHEISIWVELFVIDKDFINSASFENLKTLAENFYYAVMGVKWNSQHPEKREELMIKALNTFHNYVMNYVQENSSRNYDKFKEAYDKKDRSIFETEEISLLFRAACQAYRQQIDISWLTEDDDENNE